jgi:SAM-dependent methyltransferase
MWRSGGDLAWLLDQLILPPDVHVVELGCGPRGYLELLADRVGQDGRIVAVEYRATAVAKAQRLVRDRGLSNVEIRRGDARASGLPRASFDLVVSRMVLFTVPRPEEIIAEACALVRPGGVVAFHEADSVSHICDPPAPAWDRLIDLLDEFARRNEIDLYLGRRLPRLLREAGLVDVQARPHLDVYPPGHRKRAALLEFTRKFSDRLLAQAIVSPAELDDLMRALARHVTDAETLVVSHLFLQSWGRKPVDAAGRVERVGER